MVVDKLGINFPSYLSSPHKAVEHPVWLLIRFYPFSRNVLYSSEFCNSENTFLPIRFQVCKSCSIPDFLKSFMLLSNRILDITLTRSHVKMLLIYIISGLPGQGYTWNCACTYNLSMWPPVAGVSRLVVTHVTAACLHKVGVDAWPDNNVVTAACIRNCVLKLELNA